MRRDAAAQAPPPSAGSGSNTCSEGQGILFSIGSEQNRKCGGNKAHLHYYGAFASLYNQILRLELIFHANSTQIGVFCPNQFASNFDLLLPLLPYMLHSAFRG